MIPYKDRGIYRLKAVDNLMQILEEHQVQLSSMKTTRYRRIFVFTLHCPVDSVGSSQDCPCEIVSGSSRRS